jgi:hypothetical protein
MTEIKTLQDMTDDELLQGCRKKAEETQFGYNNYYREIERRVQYKHTRAMIWLTRWIAVLTLVVAIPAGIEIVKFVIGIIK